MRHGHSWNEENKCRLIYGRTKHPRQPLHRIYLSCDIWLHREIKLYRETHSPGNDTEHYIMALYLQLI